MAALTKVKLCQLDDLMPFIGATVLIEGEHVALFYIPDSGVYAVQDWDPIGKAYDGGKPKITNRKTKNNTF